MKLPFIKSSKWPRIGPKQDEKLVQGSESDHLQDYCLGELMDAIEQKNVKAFRSALEALFLDMFEMQDEESKDV